MYTFKVFRGDIIRMYDFRFNRELMQSFVGLQITSYKCTDTITEMVDIQIGDNVYCLTNEYEELDYFLLENEIIDNDMQIAQ